MSLSNIFSVAGSAMNAQSQRLNTVASNLANADSATSADGTPYRAKQVVFAATPVGAAERCAALRLDADEVICARMPARFRAVSQGYLDFDQVDDEEVRELLALSAQAAPA